MTAILTIAITAALSFQTPDPAKPHVPTPAEKARELLDSVLDQAPGAEPETGAMALMHVAENYESVDHKKALEAMNRAFDLTLGIAPQTEGRREQAQSQIASATVAISLPDAIAMLRRILAVDVDEAEDLRQQAINATVARLLQKAQFDDGIDLINSVGATGHYPFTAAREIFEKLPQNDPRRLSIFGYALSAYTLRPSDDFAQFLAKHWKSIPKSTADAAVTQIVQTILARPDEGVNEALGAEKGSLTLHGRHNVELFDLMHILREIDPKRAAEILDRRPELKAALDRFPNGRADLGLIGNTSRSTGDADASDSGNAAAIAALTKISNESGNDNKLSRMLDAARSVKSPGARVQLLASLISGAGAADPAAAGSVLSECIDLLKTVTDPQLRAETWANLAMAAHDPTQQNEAIDHALEDADRLYKTDVDPDSPNTAKRDWWPSSNAYRHIVIAAVKIFGVNADRILPRISDRDINLFARVEMAQALLGKPHNMWMTGVNRKER